MIEGQWTTEWYKTDQGGQFVRPPTRFRSRPTPDDLTTGELHLYVSLACPWAHRTLMLRAWHELEDVISVSVVHPIMDDNGWRFDDTFDEATRDHLLDKSFLREIYAAAESQYTGRVTVPVLWHRSMATIVCNESREIIEYLDECGAARSGNARLWPDDERTTVDDMIDANYNTVNNGVYRAGFATSQSAYEAALLDLFARLDALEYLLASRRYLCGDRLTTADLCLFATLVRFDPVYFSHFKCNIRPITAYPNLWGFVRELYQMPWIRPTCNFEHIKTHYYASHPTINPTRIVPVGPLLDFLEPHGRDQ